VTPAIDLDCEHGIRAIEVEDVHAGGVLASKLEASGPLAELAPQYDFRQRHLLTQLACTF
jgi:hypothetical protein